MPVFVHEKVATYRNASTYRVRAETTSAIVARRSTASQRSAHVTRRTMGENDSNLPNSKPRTAECGRVARLAATANRSAT